jgi:hypothetical protein
MPKRFGLAIVLVTAILGIILIGLDIFDIEEDFRIHLPTSILNTAFISGFAVPVVYIAARNSVIMGSRQMLWLGCGALAFGVGTLLRGWLGGKGLNVPITIYDSTVLIASVLHLTGASLSIAKLRIPQSEFRRKPRIILSYYLFTLASMALVTLLAFRGVIPPFYVPEESSTLLRDTVRGTAAVFFLASSSIYLRLYFKSRTDSLYWYSLGLMLFAFGLIFMSQGAVDSRIAWLGRASQYIGSIYFLVAVLGAYGQVKCHRGEL